jgi:hypothetical protein
MKRIAITVVCLVSNVVALPVAVAEPGSRLIPSPGGLTVYDTVLKVNWLANANLPSAAKGKLGVENINPAGSMDYSTALRWVAALNGLNGGVGYLGHGDWQLPATPHSDDTCSATGPEPYKNSFGFGCMKSAMGHLYYASLGLHHPDTAVPARNDSVGPFRNFQPYLYWSDTPSGHNDNGYNTFSFNTGWLGSNVDAHYMYALPMIVGRVPCTARYCPRYHATGPGTLQASEDGQVVYDPDAVYDATGARGVTWLANADLAMSLTFGAQCVNAGDGTSCINRDGSMTRTTAGNWIAGMNAYAGGSGWLGQSNWQLPPTLTADVAEANCIPGFRCADSPMGELFYQQLGLSQGTPVIPAMVSCRSAEADESLDDLPSNVASAPAVPAAQRASDSRQRCVDVGPFRNVQPYLYWSCLAAPDSQALCQTDPPAPGFDWSFSFGNGFQGTDVKGNNLYVMVYYPQTPAEALAEAIGIALSTSLQRSAFLWEAAGIGSAANAQAKSTQLATFVGHVNSQRGKALRAEQADQLIALAQSI